MSGDSELITEGWRLYQNFLNDEADDAELTSVMVRWDQHVKNVKAANKDRSRINLHDELESADVSGAGTEKVSEKFSPVMKP